MSSWCLLSDTTASSLATRTEETSAHRSGRMMLCVWAMRRMFCNVDTRDGDSTTATTPRTSQYRVSMTVQGSTQVSYWINCLAELFYRASSYASAVLAVVILSARLPSVCLSVCHTRALWQNQTMHCGYFDTTRKGNHSSWFSDTNSDWWVTPSSVWNLRSNWPTPTKNAHFDRFPLMTSQP